MLVKISARWWLILRIKTRKKGYIEGDMMMHKILVLLLILVMSACAPTTSTTPDPNNNTGGAPTPTREGDDSGGVDVSGDPGSGFGLGDAPEGTGFVAQLDGAETADITGAGAINCENGMYVIRADMSSFPQISLILPSGASPETFTLANNTGDGSVASGTVFFEDGRVFATNVEGILIINEIANSPNQTVRGSFDFSASSGAETINARGEFEFMSGADAVYCS